MGQHADIEPRQAIPAAIERAQVRELGHVVERRNAPLRTVERENALRLVTGDAPVAVEVVFTEAEGLERLVVEVQIDTPVLLVALVVGQPAGRGAEQQQNG